MSLVRWHKSRPGRPFHDHGHGHGYELSFGPRGVSFVACASDAVSVGGVALARRAMWKEVHRSSTRGHIATRVLSLSITK